MANNPIANEDPFKNMIGTENDLNRIMSNFVDSEDEIMNFCESRYIDMCDIESAFRNNQNEFVVLSLNIQSIKAKFDNFFAIINRLSSLGIFFGAICLQQTWLTANADLLLLQMPGYKLIHQGHICSKHGGLLIYLNDDFTYDQSINILTSGKAYLLTFQDLVSIDRLLSAIYTGHLMTTIIMGTFQNLPKNFRLLLIYYREKISTQQLLGISI